MNRVVLVILFVSVFGNAQEKAAVRPRLEADRSTRVEGQFRLHQKLIETARQEVASNPESAVAHFRLASALSLGPNSISTNEEIIREYQKAIALRPDYAEAYCKMAIIYGDMSRRSEELEAFNKALLLKPDYAEAYCYLGFALLEEEAVGVESSPERVSELERSAKSFEKAIQIKPTLPEAYEGLGDANYRLGLFNESIAAFTKALLLKPNDPFGHLGIGNAHVKLGNKESAIGELEALNRIADRLRHSLRNQEEYDPNADLAAKYADYLLKRIQERFGAK
jgi:tetratricopeptide (TPR) repeat protein